MNSAEAVFRRVLVALDATAASRRAVEASAEMATRLRAELVGLFVEDVNLLRLAAFPAARVLAPGSAECELDVPTLERALRAAATEARVLLESLAQKHALPCAFRVVRGVVAAELVAGSVAGDLVVVDRRIAQTSWAAIAAGARASVLVLGPHERGHDGLVAIYPAEPHRETGIAAVARLAAATGRPLAVVRPAGADGEEFDRRLAALLEPHRVRWEVIPAPRDVEDLATAVRAYRGALVAMPSELLAEAGTAPDALLRRADFPMLLVR